MKNFQSVTWNSPFEFVMITLWNRYVYSSSFIDGLIVLFSFNPKNMVYFNLPKKENYLPKKKNMVYFSICISVLTNAWRCCRKTIKKCCHDWKHFAEWKEAKTRVRCCGKQFLNMLCAKKKKKSVEHVARFVGKACLAHFRFQFREMEAKPGI